MGTPPCESGFMKATVARRWETAESRTEYGFEGTSEKTQKTESQNNEAIGGEARPQFGTFGQSNAEVRTFQKSSY